MKYSEPVIRPGGDRYLLMQFGDEMSLDLNFLAQGLASAIVSERIPGVVETAPCFASLLVHYEPELTSYDKLSSELIALTASLGSPDDLVLESRLFYLPAFYLDPWTKACVEDYCAKIAPKTWDPELIASVNGLDGVDEFVRVHSASEYWIAALGFWPGLPFMMPLDPRSFLTAPKYNPPRTNTPTGTLGLGGAANSIYPVATPGGYQIFGRTPVPIWDPQRRFPEFADSVCLFRPGDRIKYVPCTLDEFTDIERRVADGSYDFTMVEYQRFSVRDYKAWAAKLSARRPAKKVAA